MPPEAPAAASPRFLDARWIHLAMLNYEVDPDILTPRVPAGTQLDAWQGRAFVSMVGFQFLDTRVFGVPVPFHRDFDEVNLRFYVRRAAAEGVRRGVVFVKEIVPRRAIAAVARGLYNENYVALPMRHRDELADPERASIAYEWRHRGRWDRLGVSIEGPSFLPDESSEEAFITEHYWGYAAQRDGGTLEYRVEHPRWRVWRAVRTDFDCDVAALYGAEFREALARPPCSAFLAEGSQVRVLRGRRLAARDDVSRPVFAPIPGVRAARPLARRSAPADPFLAYSADPKPASTPESP